MDSAHRPRECGFSMGTHGVFPLGSPFSTLRQVSRWVHTAFFPLGSPFSTLRQVSWWWSRVLRCERWRSGFLFRNGWVMVRAMQVDPYWKLYHITVTPSRRCWFKGIPHPKNSDSINPLPVLEFWVICWIGVDRLTVQPDVYHIDQFYGCYFWCGHRRQKPLNVGWMVNLPWLLGPTCLLGHNPLSSNSPL